MHIPPEVQAQLNEQKKQCMFCKIISGEMASTKLFSDDQVIAIQDINPCVKGHTLVLPHEHYPILPYLPPDQFKHFFSGVVALAGAIQKAMLATGLTLFIANGAVAGQQAPHFLLHILPREVGDEADYYHISLKKEFEASKMKSDLAKLAQALSTKIRGDASSVLPSYLSEIKKESLVIFEDDQILLVSHQPQAIGHLTIYSKIEAHDLIKLTSEQAVRIFSIASIVAQSAFETLQVQGTNIILKSGKSNDNPSGLLSVHILPRSQEDGLDLIPKPMKNKGDLKSAAARINEETFFLKHQTEKKTEVIHLDAPIPLIKTTSSPFVSSYPPTRRIPHQQDPKTEIRDAIHKLRN